MTRNKAHLADYQEFKGGSVAFGGSNGRITSKGKIEAGRTPSIGFMRPFGCPMTIINTLDPLGKFDGKADEGFLVGYFEINLTLVQVSKNILMQKKQGRKMFNNMCFFPLWSSGSKNPYNTDDDAAFGGKKPEFERRKPASEVQVSPSSSAQTKKHDDKTKREAKGKSLVELSIRYRNLSAEFKDFLDNSINEVNAADTPVPAVGQISTTSTNTFSVAGPSNTVVSPTLEKSSYMDPSQYPDDPNMPALEDITYSDDEEDVGAEADFTNLETNITVSPILTTRVHKDHPVTQIIGDLSLATQIRSMTRVVKDQGHTQEEGIDYEEVFAPVARIEAIRLFLAYASFMGFMVYQIHVKSAFLYGTIEEEVYVYQPLRFEDPDYPNKVYKVVKILYILHQAPKAWYENLANYLLENGFQRGKIDQNLFIKKQKDDILLVQHKPDGIFISHDKYVAEILRKFGLTDGKSASTPIDTEKPLLKDPEGKDVDVHTYRSMIGSLMYLTSSRPDIMFVVCACARFQVTPKALHLHVVKRIFRYLKGKPYLGLWYPKDLPFNLVAYSDSDYAGVSLDRKSTTGGCQFLGCRLIFWQCKKQTVVATSSTEAEYVAAVAQSSMKSLKRNLHVTNILSAGKFTTPQMVNDVTRLQALIDRKKVIITEATIQEALRLDDAESIDCLPNEEIFTELSRMGLLRNVDSSTKFYTYPRFLQLMIRAQVGAASVDVDVVPAAVEPSIPSPTPTTQPPPPSQELLSTSQVIPTPPPSPIAEPSSPPQQQQPSQHTHDAEISLDLLQPLLETRTTLTRKVEALEQDKVAQALEIIKLKQRVKKLERKNKLKTVYSDDDEDVGAEADMTNLDTNIPAKHADKVLSMQDDELEPAELKEVVEVVTTAKLMTEVVTTASATITAATTLITAAIIIPAPIAARRRK
nr:hypothetical protein [Tanacetum cinerariifolium]